MSRNGGEGGSALMVKPEPGMRRWDPWENFGGFTRSFDRMFPSFFAPFGLDRYFPEGKMEFVPAVDIFEDDSKVVFYAGLPGFKSEEVHIEATPTSLDIRGDRNSLVAENEKSVKHKDSGMSRSCTFHLSYSLPSEVNPNHAKASFKDGILTLELPKVVQEKPMTVKVPVHS